MQETHIEMDSQAVQLTEDQNEPPQALGACSSLSSFSFGKSIPIVMISESLLQRATALDGRILRDQVQSGFPSPKGLAQKLAPSSDVVHLPVAILL